MPHLLCLQDEEATRRRIEQENHIRANQLRLAAEAAAEAQRQAALQEAERLAAIAEAERIAKVAAEERIRAQREADEARQRAEEAARLAAQRAAAEAAAAVRSIWQYMELQNMDYVCCC